MNVDTSKSIIYYSSDSYLNPNPQNIGIFQVFRKEKTQHVSFVVNNKTIFSISSASSPSQRKKFRLNKYATKILGKKAVRRLKLYLHQHKIRYIYFDIVGRSNLIYSFIKPFKKLLRKSIKKLSKIFYTIKYPSSKIAHKSIDLRENISDQVRKMYYKFNFRSLKKTKWRTIYVRHLKYLYRIHFLIFYLKILFLNKKINYKVKKLVKVKLQKRFKKLKNRFLRNKKGLVFILNKLSQFLKKRNRYQIKQIFKTADSYLTYAKFFMNYVYFQFNLVQMRYIIRKSFNTERKYIKLASYRKNF